MRFRNSMIAAITVAALAATGGMALAQEPQGGGSGQHGVGAGPDPRAMPAQDNMQPGGMQQDGMPMKKKQMRHHRAKHHMKKKTM